jgi:hypothetical protein
MRENGIIDALRCVGHRWNSFLEHMDKCVELSDALEPIYYVNNAIRGSLKNRELLTKAQVANQKKVLMPISGATTRWTYDTKVLTRAERIEKEVFEIYMNFFFTTVLKKQLFMENVMKWQGSSKYILNYTFPIYDRINYWIMKTEYAKSPSISLVKYMIEDVYCLIRHLGDDLISKCNDDESDNGLNFYRLPIQRILKTFKEELFVVFRYDWFYEECLYNVASILDIRTVCGSPLGGRYLKESFLADLYASKPNNYQIPESKNEKEWLLYFYESHRLSKLIFPPIIQLNNNVVNNIPEPVTFRRAPFAQQINNNSNRNNNNITSRRQMLENEIELYFKIVTEIYNKIQTKYSSIDDQYAAMFEHDPLLFWGKYEEKLPLLSRIASVILEIPCQVAGSERYFSGMTNVLSKKRSSLEKQLGGGMITCYMRATKKVIGPRLLKKEKYFLFGKPLKSIQNMHDFEDDLESDFVPNDELSDDGDNDTVSLDNENSQYNIKIYIIYHINNI